MKAYCSACITTAANRLLCRLLPAYPVGCSPPPPGACSPSPPYAASHLPHGLLPTSPRGAHTFSSDEPYSRERKKLGIVYPADIALVPLLTPLLSFIKLPPWVSLLVTSRPQVEAWFKGWTPERIDAGDERNIRDIVSLLRQRLQEGPYGPYVAAVDVDEATQLMFKKSMVRFPLGCVCVGGRTQGEMHALPGEWVCMCVCVSVLPVRARTNVFTIPSRHRRRFSSFTASLRLRSCFPFPSPQFPIPSPHLPHIRAGAIHLHKVCV